MRWVRVARSGGGGAATGAVGSLARHWGSAQNGEAGDWRDGGGL